MSTYAIPDAIPDIDGATDGRRPRHSIEGARHDVRDVRTSQGRLALPPRWIASRRELAEDAVVRRGGERSAKETTAICGRHSKPTHWPLARQWVVFLRQRVCLCRSRTIFYWESDIFIWQCVIANR